MTIQLLELYKSLWFRIVCKGTVQLIICWFDCEFIVNSRSTYCMYSTSTSMQFTVLLVASYLVLGECR